MASCAPLDDLPEESQGTDTDVCDDNQGITEGCTDDQDEASFSEVDAPRLVLDDQHCRAVSNNRVCGLAANQCTRSGHKGTAVERGPVGACENLGRARTNSRADDGDLSTVIPMTDYLVLLKAESERTLADNIASGQGLADVNAKSPFKADSSDADGGLFKSDPTCADGEDAKTIVATSPREFLSKAIWSVADTFQSPPKLPATDVGTLAALERKQKAAAQLQLECDRAVEAERLAEEQAQADAQATQQAHAAAQAEAALDNQIGDLQAKLAALEAQRMQRLTQQRSTAPSGACSTLPPAVAPGPAPPSAPAPAPASALRHPGPPPCGLASNHAPLVPAQGHQNARVRITPPPPDVFTFPSGHDPNTNNDEVFNADERHGEEILQELFAADFGADLHGEFETLLPDVVSPSVGTFQTNAESTQEELASGFISALENHTNGIQRRRGQFLKQDATWSSIARVGLSKVKHQQDFQRLHQGCLLKERDFAARFGDRVRSLVFCCGFATEDIQQFVDSSRCVLLAIRAHDLCGRLLAHLDAEINRLGFRAVKPVISLFAAELTSFRDDFSRLGMWINTHVFLRNLHQNKFWTQDRQFIVNSQLLDATPHPEGGGGGGGGGDRSDDEPTCNHCQGHPSGNCPLKAAGVPRKKSRTLAAKAASQRGSWLNNIKKLIAKHLEEEKEEEKEEQKETVFFCRERKSRSRRRFCAQRGMHCPLS